MNFGIIKFRNKPVLILSEKSLDILCFNLRGITWENKELQDNKDLINFIDWFCELGYVPLHLEITEYFKQNPKELKILIDIIEIIIEVYKIDFLIQEYKVVVKLKDYLFYYLNDLKKSKKI